jgi:hypothetical protein
MSLEYQHCSSFLPPPSASNAAAAPPPVPAPAVSAPEAKYRGGTPAGRKRRVGRLSID